MRKIIFVRTEQELTISLLAELCIKALIDGGKQPYGLPLSISAFLFHKKNVVVQNG